MARELRIPEPHVKRARAAGAASHETPGFIVIDGELETGQRLRLYCSPSWPEFICFLRVVA